MVLLSIKPVLIDIKTCAAAVVDQAALRVLAPRRRRQRAGRMGQWSVPEDLRSASSSSNGDGGSPALEGGSHHRRDRATSQCQKPCRWFARASCRWGIYV